MGTNEQAEVFTQQVVEVFNCDRETARDIIVNCQVQTDDRVVEAYHKGVKNLKTILKLRGVETNLAIKMWGEWTEI